MRRWVLFAITVIVLVFVAIRLGEWQFNRLADKQDENSQIRANEKHAVVDVSELVSAGGQVAENDEWRLVSATGTYDVKNQIIVRYRTRDGKSGVDVMVPLKTDSGTSVLVDRGWMETENRGEATPEEIPAPPSGTVTMTGWLRVDATGDSTTVSNQTTRAPNSARISEALGIETYGGFVDLKSEDPQPAMNLEAVELPALNNGPHFFYGIQWWFFGALAVFGFFYLMYDEVRQRRRQERGEAEAPQAATAGKGADDA